MIAVRQPEAVVVDANLFVQLIVEEPASSAVDVFLFEQHKTDRLVAPSILASEAAAAITKKVRRREISLPSAQAAFANIRESMTDGTFELLPANDFLDDAFSLSLTLHHPLHDCLYLAVAKRLALTFATGDKILALKAQRAGIDAEIVGSGA